MYRIFSLNLPGAIVRPGKPVACNLLNQRHALTRVRGDACEEWGDMRDQCSNPRAKLTMRKILTAIAASLIVAPVAQTHAMKIIVDGQGLAEVLDSITVGGASSIDVNDDQFLDNDYWQVSAAGGSVGTAIDTGGAAEQRAVSMLANGAGLTFGVYDRASIDNRVPLFSTGDPEGSQYLMSILADGSVRINFQDTGVTFRRNLFGFYLTDGETTWFSDWHLNPEMSVHAIFFAGNGDVLQIGDFAPGRFAPGEWIMAWEFSDTTGGSGDFTDFVLLVESVNPVPTPGTLALFGLGLVGVAFAVRRRRSTPVSGAR